MHLNSGKPRDCLNTHKRCRLKFARTSIRKDWSTVVFSDEHTFKQFKGGNPRHSFVWDKSVSEVSWEGDGAVGVDGGCVGRIQRAGQD